MPIGLRVLVSPSFGEGEIKRSTDATLERRVVPEQFASTEIGALHSWFPASGSRESAIVKIRMPDWLGFHEPVLVNTIGHCAGAAIFATLLWFFMLNWWRAGEHRTILPALAAALALVWNVGALIALAAGPTGGFAIDLTSAASFSVLSLLPAVLLHISLQKHHPRLWKAGYTISATAVALHIADLVTQALRLHYAALLLVVFGFVTLTAVSVVLGNGRSNRAAGSRLAAAMGLFLLALSFAHFGPASSGETWWREAALHHAGLPLAVFILLQDYRFVLLDAFVRFIVNASFAAAAVLAAMRVFRLSWLTGALERPFEAGLLFVCACLMLTLFVYVRNRIQALLTRVIFLRSNVDEALAELRQLARASHTETEFLPHAAELIAFFVRASRFELTREDCVEYGRIAEPAAIVDPVSRSLPTWTHAVVPLRFLAGDARYLLLGPRDGGRRYLSEDFAILLRLASMVVEHTEQLRRVQMQNLVAQAELAALQAQINPHFLFNSLNTLYGTIDRTNTEARRLVLDLADVFRYLLRSERTFIEVREELRIVRSYVEIETMRLGTKLSTEIEVDDRALPAMIPMLSIQPLVENAVKHGVAARKEAGFVRLRVAAHEQTISIEVSNSGPCDTARLKSAEAGIGLSNVRRRLALCYGTEAHFHAGAADGITRVGFVLPMRPSSQLAATANAAA